MGMACIEGDNSSFFAFLCRYPWISGKRQEPGEEEIFMRAEENTA
jgi:hypothetical protein